MQHPKAKEQSGDNSVPLSKGEKTICYLFGAHTERVKPKAPLISGGFSQARAAPGSPRARAGPCRSAGRGRGAERRRRSPHRCRLPEPGGT